MRTGEMIHWAKEIFPFPRSLTGRGVEMTLEYLQNINPELTLRRVKSGEAVFDWTVPKVWNVNQAFIEHLETGQKFANFNESNLHLVSYSIPVDKVMGRDELLSYIHVQEDQPDWIPYVTSYYNPTWGFCMSSKQRDALPDGDYRVLVESSLEDGEMLLGEAIFEGNLEQELFFSTYICHPSMANNEVSGPVLASALIDFLKNKFPAPQYSYRFVFVPETIGSLIYLRDHLPALKKNMVCGFNLTCVGDERAYSRVESPKGNNLADKALKAGLIGLPNVRTYSFLHRGSDERQYCAPGIDLPVATFCRSKFAEFPEYHTSADNFDLVTQEGLEGSFRVISNIIEAFETGIYPQLTTLGEPQLSQRGLYPSTSQKGNHRGLEIRRHLIAYADGTNNIFDIAAIINRPLKDLLAELKNLISFGLIESHQQPNPIRVPEPGGLFGL